MCLAGASILVSNARTGKFKPFAVMTNIFVIEFTENIYGKLNRPDAQFATRFFSNLCGLSSLKRLTNDT